MHEFSILKKKFLFSVENTDFNDFLMRGAKGPMKGW